MTLFQYIDAHPVLGLVYFCILCVTAIVATDSIASALRRRQ